VQCLPSQSVSCFSSLFHLAAVGLSLSVYLASAVVINPRIPLPPPDLYFPPFPSFPTHFHPQGWNGRASNTWVAFHYSQSAQEPGIVSFKPDYRFHLPNRRN